MSHVETPVKVNAWVDRRIAPLVLALNKIDGVLTLDSCEQGPLGRAFVFLTYGQDWKELATLIQEISNLLSNSLPCPYSMHLEWLGSNITPRAQVLVGPNHAAVLAAAVTRIAPELNRRMIELVGDTRDRVPQRLTGC